MIDILREEAYLENITNPRKGRGDVDNSGQQQTGFHDSVLLTH
jgi:hypothetical protein